MRFRFVISRRVSRVLTYLVIICVVFFCFSLISDSQSSHAPGREDRVHLEEHQHLAFGVDPFVEYKSLPKKDWHDYEAMKKERKRTGFGEGGTAVIAPDDPKTKAEELALYKANGYNGYVSDMIDLHRSVKDIRHVQCKEKKYLSRLPVVSVILPFHDEHNSTLLRSAHSIIDRTPKELLKEIILVDDESTKPFLKEPLDEYWRNQHLEHIVKVVRTKKREGLIRARQVGANAAIGEILVFLDAHSEPNYNWLPPLIEPVALDYRLRIRV
ncbi:hypothetical protein AB6A40_005959 [Gnathostoma spinigerum]|uniref:Glycosyltransferase 2-like domain-containing protein n=1 Tax=Gnathostoma spinigerum TaxID=75299 RepID=A0ABD6EGY0_9BILA